MTPLHDIGTIQHMLQFLKEKISPEKWSETPLPVIAAPRSWMLEVAQAMGARFEDADAVPDMIHGCKVVEKNELARPILIDHDGRVYPIQQGWAATAEGPQPPAPVTVQ